MGVSKHFIPVDYYYFISEAIILLDLIFFIKNLIMGVPGGYTEYEGET